MEIPSGAREFEDRREKGEACREHQRQRGAIKGTGESFEKNLSCTETLSGEGAIICLPFCSDERSPKDGPEVFLRGLLAIVPFSPCIGLFADLSRGISGTPVPAEKTVLNTKTTPAV